MTEPSKGWTAGPWKWNECGYCWLQGADGTTILCVGDEYTCPHRDDANARLISKAPELAEALRAYGRHKKNCSLDGFLRTPCDCGWAAISKLLEEVGG